MSFLPGGVDAAARAFQRLAKAQRGHARWFIVAAALLSVASALLASQLELRLRFEQLLPATRPSVIELARLEANVRAGSHAFVVIEGGDGAGQRAFGDELVARLRQRAPAWLDDASDGVQDAQRFLAPRAAMFAKLADLQQLRDEVEARWSWEVGKETGTNLDDEPAPELNVASLRARFGIAPEAERFRNGYFQPHDERALVVAVSTSIANGDLDRMQAALSLVQNETESLLRARPTALRVSYAGDLVTGLAEYGAATRDLASVGMLGVASVLAVLLLYFRSARALLILGLSLGVGLSCTFGVTELCIGHLNVATGFLVSIVAGNGINFGIIFLARFYEERRAGATLEQALETAHIRTWLGTLTAALAAAAAYGSLGISEFGAFHDFALIGSLGMLICWLTSYLVLPVLVLLLESRAVTPPKPTAQPASAARWAPPVWLPRALSLGGVGLALLGAVALVPYVKRGALEYDMRRMQNDLGESSANMYRASKLAGQILGAQLDGAMVLLADRPEQAAELRDVLNARRDRAPRDQKPFEAVHTAFDFVPSEQAAKLPLVLQISRRLHQARERGLVKDADFEAISRYLPPPALAPWGLAELPVALTRPFTDRSGIVGRLLLLEPTAGQNDSDVKYLMRWADSFRSVKVASGEVRGSGRAVIFADILATVLHDIPRTVVLALVTTVLTVVLTFRRGYQSWLVVASLLVGVGWVVLGMALAQLKINFFNFVALPISFGIGVDYAVNLMQRYTAEPERGVGSALRGTGAAVVVCSLTTIVGYLALIASVNQAIRSLGVLAVLGEVGCLLAALLVLPAWLTLRERRLAAAASTAPQPEASQRVEERAPDLDPSVAVLDTGGLHDLGHQ